MYFFLFRKGIYVSNSKNYTFTASAVEGLHSFNAHHNQLWMTIDVHNLL